MIGIRRLYLDFPAKIDEGRQSESFGSVSCGIMSFILAIVFEVVFGVIFCWTGEIIVFILSLGRHKPRWDFYTKESPARFVMFSEISVWIGMVFWFAVLVGGIKLLGLK